jgi:hypothetical protein
MNPSRVALDLQEPASQTAANLSGTERPGAGAATVAAGPTPRTPKSKPDASNTRLRVSLMRLSRALAVETPSST